MKHLRNAICANTNILPYTSMPPFGFFPLGGIDVCDKDIQNQLKKLITDKLIILSQEFRSLMPLAISHWLAIRTKKPLQMTTLCAAHSRLRKNKRKPEKQKKTFLAFALSQGPILRFTQKFNNCSDLVRRERFVCGGIMF